MRIEKKDGKDYIRVLVGSYKKGDKGIRSPSRSISKITDSTVDKVYDVILKAIKREEKKVKR